MVQLHKLSVVKLLALHVGISEELRARKITRSANNPTGDFAEYLFCKAFDWHQEPNSKHGYDAIDTDGKRYQIKGRRIHRRNKSRQLSAIRNLEDGHFDVLAGVLFDEAYGITHAALIPRYVVEEQSKFISHTNSNKFILRDEIWTMEGVEDVTQRLRIAFPK